ncbi:uncharacterized protein LOC143284762 isoform X2 [Babylonia areolata]|uniref:uncharacterized protein LOC143284762 isoform X2 n=1 Tax=Babylonia areolata TaxID=304850 RepID=UPI003FD4A3D6
MSKHGQVKTELDSAASEPGTKAAEPVTKGKRGRKKKSAEVESTKTQNKGMKQELITDHMPVEKKKRKIDRFNGMPEEEVLLKTLPDRLAHDLDILIVGINPGLFAAYIGHHYAGPGNHFWKCLYLSGLVPEPMNCYDDIKVQQFGIGFTNICARTSRGSADLKKKEIEEGGEILKEKIREYRPKIAVFNGKGIYEVFSGSKKIIFGKQAGLIEGTQTIAYVMPSSSARCSQLPRAIDKVPFYEALRRLRDYMVGRIPHLDESEVTFPSIELKTAVKKEIPPQAANNEEPGSGAGNAKGECGVVTSNSGPAQPAVKKERTTRTRGKGKKQGDQQQQGIKETLGDSCHGGQNQPLGSQTLHQDQIEEQKNQLRTEANGGPQNLPHMSTPSQHALTRSLHETVGLVPGANGLPFNPFSTVDFTSLQPAGLASSPMFHPSSAPLPPGFSTSASRDFMSGFYSGSHSFGMVGFPNVVASQQQEAPTKGDKAGKESVKIKSEPVELDS